MYCSRMAAVCVRRAARTRRRLSKPDASWGWSRADVAGTVQWLWPESVSESAVVGSVSTHATPRHCAGVREPARTERRCKRQAVPDGLQRSRATGQVRTSPARPWSRRRSGLPAFSERLRLDVIPFEPEPQIERGSMRSDGG